MDEQQLAAALAEIDEQYYAQEEDAETAIAALNGYFEQLWQDQEAAKIFASQAAQVAGGAYIPHLFWPALHRFLKEDTGRDVIAELFEAFGNSNFDEETQKIFRPLAVVYFMHEKEFEVDRLRTRVLHKLHPGVQEYFEQLIEFNEKNHRSAVAFARKFALVGDRFPDFELFNQPLAHLEEQLS